MAYRDATKHHAKTFWSQVEKTDTCWLWRGHTHRGYGRFAGIGAHRASFKIANGSIPEGMEIDHLCGNPLCVRPTHLEAVDRAENMRRRYATQTHCYRGHEFTEANTYTGGGRRRCRTCQALTVKAYQARKNGVAS